MGSSSTLRGKDREKEMKSTEKKRNRRNYSLIKLLLIILASYFVICVVLFFIQDRFIFPPAFVKNPEVTDNSDIASLEPLQITMSDGCILSGYRINATESDSENLLFYFGANAEDISTLPHKMTGLSDWTIILVNYRGYVDSEGTPSAEQLYQDSMEIYDNVVSKGENYENIVIMGRSIGSSVATCLASKRENNGLILISPFDTMEHVISCKCPILPISLVLRQKFNSIEYAPKVESVVFLLVGTKDLLVPNVLSRELSNYFPNVVSYHEIVGVGHNSIDDSAEYWPMLESFLDEIEEQNIRP